MLGVALWEIPHRLCWAERAGLPGPPHGPPGLRCMWQEQPSSAPACLHMHTHTHARTHMRQDSHGACVTFSPTAPGLPIPPGGPCGPSAPGAPEGPRGPGGPGGPWRRGAVEPRGKAALPPNTSPAAARAPREPHSPSDPRRPSRPSLREVLADPENRRPSDTRPVGMAAAPPNLCCLPAERPQILGDVHVSYA